MLIQNASDSISPPLRPSIRTRISHQRFEVPEHQRRSRSMSWNSMGRIRSIMVRRTIHSGWVSSKPSSRRWSWPMSWMCRQRRVEPQPAQPVDVGDPQWPLPVEDVRVRVGHRHQNLRQPACRCRPCVLIWSHDPAIGRPDCQVCEGRPSHRRYAWLTWPKRSSAHGCGSCAASAGSARPRWRRCWRSRRATSTRSSTTSVR